MDDVRIVLCSIRFRTWEHAAMAPRSFGVSATLGESLRLLDRARTEPIYERLQMVERLVERCSSPLPPFRARVLQDGSEPAVSQLEKRCGDILSERIGDVVGGWGALVEMAYETHGQEALHAAVSALGKALVPQYAERPVSSLYEASVVFHDDPSLASALGVKFDGRKLAPWVREAYALL
jgi:hypothetical protein